MVGVRGVECGWRDCAKVELPSTMPEMLHNRRSNPFLVQNLANLVHEASPVQLSGLLRTLT